MKKEYTSPNMELVEIELTSMLASSVYVVVDDENFVEDMYPDVFK